MTDRAVTFDTGMLIALERRRVSPLRLHRRLIEQQVRVTVPSPVIGEWWRGRTDLRDLIIDTVHVEPLTDAIARLAGEALARIEEATTVDAFVMASAALRGGTVYTGDVEDLERFCEYFPDVRVLGIPA